MEDRQSRWRRLASASERVGDRQVRESAMIPARRSGDAVPSAGDGAALREPREHEA